MRDLSVKLGERCKKVMSGFNPSHAPVVKTPMTGPSKYLKKKKKNGYVKSAGFNTV